MIGPGVLFPASFKKWINMLSQEGNSLILVNSWQERVLHIDQE
jgi:hypothetical protein